MNINCVLLLNIINSSSRLPGIYYGDNNHLNGQLESGNVNEIETWKPIMNGWIVQGNKINIIVGDVLTSGVLLQDIIYSNTDSSSVGVLGTDYSEIWIKSMFFCFEGNTLENLIQEMVGNFVEACVKIKCTSVQLNLPLPLPSMSITPFLDLFYK